MHAAVGVVEHDRVLVSRPCGQRVHTGVTIAETELELMVHLAHVEELRAVDACLARWTDALINEVVAVPDPERVVGRHWAGERAGRGRATLAGITDQMESALDL